MAELVTMRGITKRYPNGVLANEDASFSLAKGEIHAVAGENGAGKSTLMKILFGLEQPTSGEILMEGKPVRIDSPRKAASFGIGMVNQHFMLVDDLPVYQNIYLGIEKKSRLGLLNKAEMIRGVKQLCETYDMPLDPLARCGDLPVGARQKVEILKVLARGAQIIILDEPTAVLTPQETEQLFGQLRLLRDEGRTIIIITHKLQEIKALCDRITIMRSGKTVGVHRVADVTTDEISEMMVGGHVNLHVERAQREPGEERVTIENLTVMGANGKAKLKGVSLHARAGEIVCLQGVEGNGQQQVAECLSCALRGYTGSVKVMGAQVKALSVRKLRDLGFAHVHQDRMTVGTDQKASLFDNLIAVDFAKHSRFGFLKKKLLAACGEEQLKRFLVKGTLKQGIAMLSGGNMQKVAIARELSTQPQVLLADQPTRGVDIGAVAFIHEQLVKLRDAGCCIILISADLGEVLSLSDRIYVFHDGEVTAEVTDVRNATEQQLGRYMLGLERMEVQA